MSRALRSLAALAAVALGFAVIAAALGAVDPASGAVVLAVAATVVIALRLASIAPAAPAPLWARPRAPIAVSILVAQSDPAAAGPPRPRAPGRAAPAA